MYKSVIPESDFEAAGEYLARMKADRKTAEQQRYQQVGTPAEIGARQAGIQAQAASSYAASLPRGSQYDAARSVANTNFKQAQLDAISKQNAVNPQEADFIAPSWATGTSTSVEDQVQRDEEARVNRMIKAKEVAKKAKEAGVDTTQTV
jgi:hypothetical protein